MRGLSGFFLEARVRPLGRCLAGLLSLASLASLGRRLRTTPSALLAPAADSLVLAYAAASALFAPAALAIVLAETAPSTFLAKCALAVVLTDLAPATRRGWGVRG